MQDLFAIALAWLLYGVIHSVLATHWVKTYVRQSWSRYLPGYRLFYNLVALFLLLPVLGLTIHYSGPVLWMVPAWLSVVALVVAIIGFTLSLRWYDGSIFLGLSQWRAQSGPDDQVEAFSVSPLHRHVRHPWYFFALLVLWTRDLNAAWLVAAGMITLYFVLGSRLEENKLIDLYGEAYLEYRRRVPGLLPLPWRHLNKAQAMALEQQAQLCFQQRHQSC